MDKKKIISMGYDIEDVGVFLEFFNFNWNNFLRSKSLRNQYSMWKNGDIAIGGVIVNKSTDTMTTITV